MLTPQKLRPAFKDYLWGGERLRTDFGKESPLSPLAESWELSCHPDGMTYIEGGAYHGRTLADYLALLGKAGLGTRAAGLCEFPLLIKLIDANAALSLQVHPADATACREAGESGKTEMWYILDCEEGAAIYYGFARPVTREEVATAIKEERLTDLLLRVPVKRGDAFLIEAGTVHAIGAGILLCEVQQNSNTTFRVYDYGRRDKDGNTRPLHIDRALAVASLAPARPPQRAEDAPRALLAACRFFEVYRLRGENTLAVDNESFVSLVITAGEGRLTFAEGTLAFRKGDTLFLPATLGTCQLTGDFEAVEARLGKGES